jgi:hypothetical protein
MSEVPSAPVRSLCLNPGGPNDDLMPVRRHRRFPACPRCGAPVGQPCAVTPGMAPLGATPLVHEVRRPLELFDRGASGGGRV